ncbi:MAG: Rossmann-like and DUF2520 domain-containing protein [Paludibacter sp.]
MKVVFIGAGNVATHLAKTFKEKGHDIVQIYSRTQNSALELAQKLETDYCTSLAFLKEADMYIYAVSDNALESIVSQVDISSGIHVHTAGSVSINIFENKFSDYGVLYPLQTFSKNKEVDLSVIPIFVEGNNEASTDVLYSIAKDITTKPYMATSDERIRLHIAAVFACNFTNYFYTIASEIVQNNNIPFEILQPLIDETASKIKALSPYDAQTGPARRNDVVTMNKQYEMIEDENQKLIYKLISSCIVDKYQK